MQCQEELVPYKRIGGSGSGKSRLKTEKVVRLFSYRRVMFYLAAFLIARAIMVKTMMPFGMAIFIAAFNAMNMEAALLTGILVVVGYASSFNGIDSIGNMLVVATMMMAALFFKSCERNRVFKMSCFAWIMNIAVSMLFQIEFVSGSFQPYDFLFATMESFMIVAMAYIFSYGIPIYFDSNKKRQMSKEEIVCLGFILAVVVSGISGEKFFGVSFRNVATYFIILMAGYIEGPMAGAAFGITLGAVSGIAQMEMQSFTYNFGICGLIGGLFKSIGKLTSAAAFLLAYLIISTCSIGIPNLVSGLAEVIIPTALFMLVPEAWFAGLSNSIEDLNIDSDQMKTAAIKTKDLLNRKLSAISKTLDGLSDVLSQNVESELSYKGEITAMVEKLADRVCRGCSSRDTCWNKEMYHTFDAVSELLRKNEEFGILEYEQMPKELRYKCIKSNEMIKQSNYIYEMFKLNNKWRKKLVNSKIIVSEQMKGITGIMSSMTAEVLSSMEFRSDIEEQLAVALDRNCLEFEDVSVAKNGRGKYEVAVYKRHCEGSYDCKKNFKEVISGALGRRMTNEFGNCNVNEENLLCNFRFVEAENYSMATAISKFSKEDISGDSHIYGNVNDGRYLLALSDGMGSGHRAALESSTTIQLLEQFIEAGFDRSTALKAINSVLVLRSNEECFATIDMGIIDLYNGIGEFIKIGSAPTFIKSGMEVDVIKATGIPAGILDEIDIESQIINFKNGDMIVMVSDGIVDANRELSERWVTKTLRDYNSGNPKDVADHILAKARAYYGDSVKDDMTVIVSKIWKIY